MRRALTALHQRVVFVRSMSHHSSTPTFAEPGSTYLGFKQGTTSEFVVAGIPYDIGTTNRSGARFAPAAVRSASRMLLDGVHPSSWRDPMRLDVSDAGNMKIALGDIQGSLKLIEEQAAQFNHLIAIGGDHTVSLPLLRALHRKHGPVALIHFDAHVDTWSDNFGQKYAHGSVYYHAIEEGLVDPTRAVQIGIRSPVQTDTMQWTKDKGVTVITAMDVHETSPAVVAARLREVVGTGPVYLSFDIDALDPAFAPGTGTPEVGGLATWQMQGILRRLEGLRFIGMDVVEVAPAYDHAEITSVAAASVIFEYLSIVRT
eukprot:m.29696 g.29696  ORF g.29696 m.29696 type:complete len:316 (+) comp9186_c0_seq2:2750-3697(+)